MAKKEIVHRPMYGFAAGHPRAAQAEATKRVIGSEIVDRVIEASPFLQSLRAPQTKDEIIAQLRASLALLEAKEEKRRIASRESMRKKRAK